MAVLGIDLGQSHTKAILVEDGRILAEYDGPSCFFEDIEPEVSVYSGLAETLKDLKHRVTHVGVGSTGWDVPGYNECTLKFLQENVSDGPIRIESDGYTAFLGAVGNIDGVVVVAGSGVIGYGVYRGKTDMVSGHGYLAGDEGSSVWIGKEALRWALRAQDLMSPPTVLPEVLCEAFKCPDLASVNQFVRKRPQLLATVLPAISSHLQDAAVSAILNQAGMYLSQATLALCKKLRVNEPIDCVLTGGVSRVDTVQSSFQSNLRGHSEINHRIVEAKSGPEIGAVLLFAAEAGWETYFR